MRLYWSRMGPKSNMIDVLIRRGKCGHRVTQGGCHVMMEGETGVRCHRPRNTKDCWQPPESRREAWSSFSLWDQKEWILLALWFQTSGLLNYERIHFCCVKLPNMWYSVTVALESHSNRSSLISSMTRITLCYALLGIIWFGLINIETILRSLSLG